MDILDIKREFSEYKERLEKIRGSLWLRKKRGKNCSTWEKNNWGKFLVW